jgi:hypothetical protein
MSWMNARDALIAQTMAFVEQVAGKRPEAEARVETVSVDTTHQVERLRRVEAPQTIRQDSTSLADAREEIRIRVESFRAHQHRFDREREEYFNSVLAKVRASIRNEIPRA